VSDRSAVHPLNASPRLDDTLLGTTTFTTSSIVPRPASVIAASTSRSAAWGSVRTSPLASSHQAPSARKSSGGFPGPTCFASRHLAGISRVRCHHGRAPSPCTSSPPAIRASNANPNRSFEHVDHDQTPQRGIRTHPG
jgi:hypothetical protein